MSRHVNTFTFEKARAMAINLDYLQSFKMFVDSFGRSFSLSCIVLNLAKMRNTNRMIISVTTTELSSHDAQRNFRLGHVLR